MCLAVPVRVVELGAGDVAVVDLGGIRKEISLALVEDVAVGDYVILHVGYALTKLDPEEAQRTLALFAQAGLSLPPLHGEAANPANNSSSFQGADGSHAHSSSPFKGEEGRGMGSGSEVRQGNPPSPLPPLPEGEGKSSAALEEQRG